MDEKICKLFLPLLEKLYNQDPAGEPFRKPVDVVKYGCIDYYHHVKHPIDLTTIRHRLENHEYNGDAWRFVADIELLFANAYSFNRRGTPVYEYTNKLNKIWSNELPGIMQRLNYCCGNLHKFGPQLLYCYGSTFDKYCQINVGAKYKCYQDKYSFCLNCFNKINSDYIDLQKLSSCENGISPCQEPVAKSDFKEFSNDDWQYELFIQCTQCSRRVHQICELYPARSEQLRDCVQHSELEEIQKSLSKLPPEELERQASLQSQTTVSDHDEKEEVSTIDLVSIQSSLETSDDLEDDSSITRPSISDLSGDEFTEFDHKIDPLKLNQDKETNKLKQPKIEKVDEVEDQKASQISNNTKKTANSGIYSTDSSFDCPNEYRDKFVCNYCYRKKKIGFNLRHRKFSARRIPHTRMSSFIESKVNEYIKEHSPVAGQVTLRVLSAYRDNIAVKPEMQKYIEMCKENGSDHPFLQNYPTEFNYTNRAIFAWQEIDGVDVCVFGMHVQEYGDDCPEPNRNVVYLSYLDSVHFFKPKSVRTAVYHQILLSYFKYARRLEFRSIFIWVCPSRKGDDYIFYRHPTEQKMPTLRRLGDWYLSLLDKGLMEGILDRHETLFQYFTNSAGSKTILNMPYLNGDYWPGEFERLLKIMHESQKEYDAKIASERKECDDRSSVTTETSEYSCTSNLSSFKDINITFNSQPNISLDNRSSFLPRDIMSMMGPVSNSQPILGVNATYMDFHKESNNFNGSLNSFFDQPLDLSAKALDEHSPYNDHDQSETGVRINNLNRSLNIPKKRKRKNTNNLGYTKKRTRTIPLNKSQTPRSTYDSPINRSQTSTRSSMPRACTQAAKEPAPTPEANITPHERFTRDIEKALKRQKDGFMVARLSDCVCSPYFESQRRRDETLHECNLMKGREPLLQLARGYNYEFSTLRRAKFSSLAMVKHLGRSFKLEPLCHECFSFDSSKCHFVCNECDDFYLCTSCREFAKHEHEMTLLEPKKQPDMTDFDLEDLSNSSQSDSLSSSASSIISNKSYNDNSFESNTTEKSPKKQNLNLSSNSIEVKSALETKNSPTTNKPPLTCHKQRERDRDIVNLSGDQENANLDSHGTSKLSNIVQIPGNQSPEPTDRSEQFDVNLVDNFIRQAEVTYDVDFEDLRDESKDLLTHYYHCSDKETCLRCKFVVLSCSFMGIIMRNSRIQSVINNSSTPQSATLAHSQSTRNINNNAIGVNLSKRHEFSKNQNHQPRQS